MNIYERWLENAYSRPQNGSFGQFDPLNGLQYNQSQKGTSLHESTSFEPLSVKCVERSDL